MKNKSDFQLNKIIYKKRYYTCIQNQKYKKINKLILNLKTKKKSAF